MHKPELQNVLRLIRAAPFDAALSVAAVRKGLDRFAEAFPLPPGVTQTSSTLAGVVAETLVVERDGPIVLYLHGGGYVIGSPRSHRHLAAKLALEIQGTVISLDYRLAPESPFPAALDDALAAWRELASLHAPGRCAVAGDSAGGGLGFAMLAQAQAAGLPMPGCLVGFSPWVNLGTGNTSYDRLAAVDPMLSREVVEYFVSRYAPTINRRDAGVSPLFASLEGLPPTLIQIGDHECFYGDATLMHEALIAAGVDSELTVWKQMFHVWQLYWPMLEEGRTALEQAARFISRHCSH